MGDYSGNIILLKNREPVFIKQASNVQIVSVKILSVSLRFAVMTSDGVLKICHFTPLARRE